MLRAVDAAKFFIYLMQGDENDLTNTKLNKLLYYAQGHSLEHNGNPLFADKIEAWQYGPVVPNVYHKYKNDDILTCDDSSLDLSKYSDEDQVIMIDVARELGKYSASELTNMTHRPGTPWTKFYDQDSRHVEIPKEELKAYFKKHPVKPFEVDFSGMEEAGYRDEEGHYVIKKGYEW
jgi:uncharacterized phage-associated protein